MVSTLIGVVLLVVTIAGGLYLFWREAVPDLTSPLWRLRRLMRSKDRVQVRDATWDQLDGAEPRWLP